MTTKTIDIIQPIVTETYGVGVFVETFVGHLAKEIAQYDGDDRERMVMMNCWNWFPGGTTAENTAAKIERALEETENTMTDQQQTAMLLTQQEWDDLAHICELYRLQYEQHPAFTSDDDTKRRLKLAERIVCDQVRRTGDAA